MSDLIPTLDLTQEAEFDLAYQEALSNFQEAMDKPKPFVAVYFDETPVEGKPDETNIRVGMTVLGHDRHLEAAAMAVLTMFGESLLPPQARQLPDELRQMYSIQTAMVVLNQKIQARMAPHTPAGDAAAETQH